MSTTSVFVSSVQKELVYLAEGDRHDLYVGLFGDRYGVEDTAGVSSRLQKYRLTEQGRRVLSATSKT